MARSLSNNNVALKAISGAGMVGQESPDGATLKTLSVLITRKPFRTDSCQISIL